MTLDPAIVLREYEHLLVHSERFALADAVRAVHESEHVLTAVQMLAEVLIEPPPSSSSTTVGSSGIGSVASSSVGRAAPTARGSKRLSLRDVTDGIARRAATAEALVPTFLGPSELLMFAKALRELVRTPEIEAFWGLELDAHERDTLDVLVRVLRRLEQCLEALHAATATTAEHLIRLLDDAAEIVANSHSQRLLQYQQQIDASIESYRTALQAQPLCDAKQLEFAAKSIETSVAMMLLPHFEICRTITTASAHVEGNAGFTSAERSKVAQFVQTATRLKDRTAGFDSVLGDASAFIDAFSVCSSALKLQFRERLDEELFQAYVQDWKATQQAAQTVKRSAEFRAATERLEGLKTQMLHLHRAVQKSKQVESSDDPMRTRLSHESLSAFSES
ncbi:hypothetical protein PybrP1_005416 [[Pythium] brassicae (nom. inval.)]|nr:hypothetical protein PybrP1_005416 [[Pythium] brassicae (nom. inval.)]